MTPEQARGREFFDALDPRALLVVPDDTTEFHVPGACSATRPQPPLGTRPATRRQVFLNKLCLECLDTLLIERRER